MSPRFALLFAVLWLSACADEPRSEGDAAVMDAGVSADARVPDGATPTSDGGVPSGHVFDHRHTTVLDAMPDACRAHLTSGDFVVHYAHRSHGSQITVGAELLEDDDARFAFDAEYCDAPSADGVLPVWDGMTSDTGATVVADQYWATDDGVDELRGILTARPEIGYTSWAWSYDLASHTEESVQRYLDTLSALELEFPAVTFIYMTGPADAGYDDATYAHRARLNRRIRDYCLANGKVLFDFEDIDATSGDETASITVDGENVPMRHADYDYGYEAGYEGTHTNPLACRSKARAFWWMLGALEGCASP